jgi:hypothetical protein
MLEIRSHLITQTILRDASERRRSERPERREAVRPSARLRARRFGASAVALAEAEATV